MLNIGDRCKAVIYSTHHTVMYHTHHHITAVCKPDPAVANLPWQPAVSKAQAPCCDNTPSQSAAAVKQGEMNIGRVRLACESWYPAAASSALPILLASWLQWNLEEVAFNNIESLVHNRAEL